MPERQRTLEKPALRRGPWPKGEAPEAGPLRRPFTPGSCFAHENCEYETRVFLRWLEWVEFREDGHWIWTGAKFSTNGELGYCHAGRNRPERARPLAWWFFRGPVPEGSEVSRCLTEPLCCNPDHLYLADSKEGVGGIGARRISQVVELLEGELSLELRPSVTLREVGELFGVTHEAVRLVLKGQINGGRGKLSEEDCELIRKIYWRQSKSDLDAKIGEALGISAKQAQSYRSRAA